MFPIRRPKYSGSGSGSWFRNLPSTKNYLLSSTTAINVHTVRNKQKNLKQQLILLASWKPLQKRTEGSGSVIQWYGSADPDPSQNIPDPEHCGTVLYPVPVDGKDGRTLVTFDSVSVAGTNMAARTLAARLQNRFLQDHLVHNAIVHRPAYEKKLRNWDVWIWNFSFITDPNLSCSHGVSSS